MFPSGPSARLTLVAANHEPSSVTWPAGAEGAAPVIMQPRTTIPRIKFIGLSISLRLPQQSHSILYLPMAGNHSQKHGNGDIKASAPNPFLEENEGSVITERLQPSPSSSCCSPSSLL